MPSGVCTVGLDVSCATGAAATIGMQYLALRPSSPSTAPVGWTNAFLLLYVWLSWPRHWHPQYGIISHAECSFDTATLALFASSLGVDLSAFPICNRRKAVLSLRQNQQTSCVTTLARAELFSNRCFIGRSTDEAAWPKPTNETADLSAINCCRTFHAAPLVIVNKLEGH
jgi:hypothetical protein